jgi:hypothetical protein
MLHVWVERIVAPSGNIIVIGLLSICLLTTWAPSQMKWLVAPELLRAVVVSLLLCCGPFVWTVCSSSSSSSAERAAKELQLLAFMVGFVASGKHGKHVCLDLLATFHAPPCQACSGIGLVGMMTL